MTIEEPGTKAHIHIYRVVSCMEFDGEEDCDGVSALRQALKLAKAGMLEEKTTDTQFVALDWDDANKLSSVSLYEDSQPKGPAQDR